MRRHFLVLLIALDIFVVVSPGSTTGTASSRRPAQVDDLLAAVSIGSVSFAPDGQALAFSMTRRILDVPPEMQSSFLSDETRSDIWLQDAPGRAPRNLTNGQTDLTGAWDPIWAPDGARLAFLSTRGGRGVGLWIWERSSGRMWRARTPGVTYNEGREDGTCRWLDTHRILCFVEPDGGEVRPETAVGNNARSATEAWARAARGEVTASVLTSTEFRLRRQGIWVVDVQSDSGRMVGTTVETRHWQLHSSWLSRDGRTLALVRPIAVPYNLMALIRMGVPVPIDLQRLDGSKIILNQPLPQNIHAQTLKWSPDGQEIAFFANGPGPVDPVLLFGASAAAAMPPERVVIRGNPAKFYRVNVARGTIVSWNTGDIDLGALGSPEFFWTAEGEIVVSAPRRQYGFSNGPPPSRGARFGWTSSNAVPLGPALPASWWVIGRNGQTRALATEEKPLPASLRPVEGGRAFVGVQNGELWRIVPSTGNVTNVTATFSPRVQVITSLPESSSRDSDHTIVIRAAVDKNESRIALPSSTRPESTSGAYFRVDLPGGTITPLATSIQTGKLLDYAPRSDSAAYVLENRDGTVLWRTESGKSEREVVVEANTYIREIQEPHCRIISYRGLNHEPLQGQLCLPINYVNGRRHPLIVDVYYGRVVGDSRSPRLAYGDIFTSAGYAHLVPSIPVRPVEGIPEEGNAVPMAVSAILPAVEASVSSGIVDADRVFLYGGSQGGWTVLVTIGQTTRFKAAVSQAYGDGARIGALDFHYHSRYSDTDPTQMIDPTGGYMKSFRPSDLPWWRDGDTYRRNHALTYVDRVQTPVMLIHGDLDPIPFDASEGYFYALVSMRKPAEFVRYWGEGHNIQTPANVRDKYRRILAWFDRWGDMARDTRGELIFEGDTTSSRKGAPPLTPEDFSRFGPTTVSRQTTR